MTPGDGRAMLEGVRVVDMTGVVFGPYATRILADLGAEVVKVEPPRGDPFRYSAKPAVTPGMAPGFMALNRGKRSVALDLKLDEDRARMRDLLGQADCFIHNVRRDAIERLGFGYEAVRALRPDIVYAHCLGFGSDGPHAGLQAYDDVIQAASGTATLLPRADGNPRPRYLPSLIADKVAGLHAAYAVLAALVHRLRTGRGQFVEVPMMECFSSFMLLEHLGGLTFDPPVGEACYPRQVDPDRQPFPTADGHVAIVFYDDPSILRVFDLLDVPDTLAQPDFASPQLRARNIGALYRAVATLTPRFSTADLVRRCREADIPAQPVRDMADILSEPQLAATGFFRRREHPSEGAWRDTEQPVRFSDRAPADPLPPPHLDEHGGS